MELTRAEVYLLDWLAKEDISALYECEGHDLDQLVLKGLAIITGRAVLVTPLGFAVAAGDPVALQHLDDPLILMEAWCFWSQFQGKEARLMAHYSKAYHQKK